MNTCLYDSFSVLQSGQMNTCLLTGQLLEPNSVIDLEVRDALLFFIFLSSIGITFYGCFGVYDALLFSCFKVL